MATTSSSNEDRSRSTRDCQRPVLLQQRQVRRQALLPRHLPHLLLPLQAQGLLRLELQNHPEAFAVLSMSACYCAYPCSAC